MKLLKTLAIAGMMSLSTYTAASAALQPGDIAFTGFNADSTDDIAFVTFKDIPAGDTLRFCDDEWNGTTGFTTGEGDFSWVASTLVPAGTVVTINGLSTAAGSATASTGTLPLTLDNSGGMSTSGEAMFIFQGPAARTITTVLAAVANDSAAFGNLAGSGLIMGSTAIRLTSTTDMGVYNGPRTGMLQAGYLSALNNMSNWLLEDTGVNDAGNGTGPELPFNITAFTLGAASVDTVKPTITNVAVTNATTLEITFSEAVDSASAVNTANYVLNPVLTFSAAAYNAAQKKVTLTHAAFANATNYVLQVTGVKDTANNVMSMFTSTALSFSSVVIPALSFNVDHYSVKENAGSVTVRLNASAAPSDTASVQIQIVAGGTAVAGTDFTFSDQTFVWPKDSAGFRTVSIPLTNNATAQADRFFVLDLKSPANATLGTNKRLVVYILDDDTQAPARSDELALKFVSSYKVDTTTGASAEIVAYDPSSKRLFAMNSTRDKLEILNFKNPKAISKIATIDLLAYGSGGTSVASKNGLVAVTIDAANFMPGKVVFLDTNGTVISNVTVGSLPDMVTFSPDGKFVLAANEGQPSTDYLTDPEGSVSVIDISGGVAGVSQSNVTTMNFNAFDAQKATLQAAGVRIFGANNPTVSKDLEPEYITVSEDSKTAWITLQENNAIAKADLTSKTITNIFPLGLKDHSLTRNAFDASDVLDSVFMGTWPVKGMYMPDAIASLKVLDTTYLITANEGDSRVYGTFSEEVRVGASGYKLDSTVFPNAAILKLNNNLGRLTVTNASGDLDNDGDFDQIHVYGARSISVWNGTTGAQVWDGGNELELITAKDSAFGKIFNASNDNATFKNRSDNKGPEPEGVAIGKVGSKSYAFVALERTGGLVAYDVTNPKAPRYVAYANNRSLTGTANSDLGGEGIIFIPRAQSPNDTSLVVIANEISATVSVFSVRDTSIVVGIRNLANAAASAEALTLHRAPGLNLVFFSRPVDFRLTDARGKVLRSGSNAAWVDLDGLRQGRYFLSVPGSKTFVLQPTR